MIPHLDSVSGQEELERHYARIGTHRIISHSSGYRVILPKHKRQHRYESSTGMSGGLFKFAGEGYWDQHSEATVCLSGLRAMDVPLGETETITTRVTVHGGSLSGRGASRYREFILVVC